jgi:hypothetical protein
MAELDPAVEQQLAELDDADWHALTARVRPPTSSQQLRDIAGRVLEGNALDSFVAVADPRKFANEIGDVDEAKVMGHLTALFATSQQQPQPPQRGQHSGYPSGDQPRESGRDALKRRWGVGADQDKPAPGGQIPRGQRGRDALARRHGAAKR